MSGTERHYKGGHGVTLPPSVTSRDVMLCHGVITTLERDFHTHYTPPIDIIDLFDQSGPGLSRA